MVFQEVISQFPPLTHPQNFYTYLSQRHNLPGIFYIDAWPILEPQIIITDADAAAQVLTVTPYPKHRRIEIFLRPFTGPNSIAASNGERWKYNHRMVGSGFTQTYIKQMIGLIADEAQVFHDRLHDLAIAGEPFCLEEEAAKAVFDVIGRIVFGCSLKAQKSGSPLLDDLRASIDPATAVLATWNPVARLAAWRRLRGVKRRVHDALAVEMRERYQVMKDEKELPSRRQARSILDRIILDRIQSDPSAGLEDAFIETAVTK